MKKVVGVVSHTIKPIKGLGETTREDMMEAVGTDDPSALGSDTLTPGTPWDGGKDKAPSATTGNGQKDD